MDNIDNIIDSILIDSILYAISDYKYRKHKQPDRILVNNLCYVKLMNHLSYNNDTIKTFCNIPISKDSTDATNIPRFYLCEEGIIYNN